MCANTEITLIRCCKSNEQKLTRMTTANKFVPLRIEQQDLRCRQGCGYYGNYNFDGLCSKCFRDRNASLVAQSLQQHTHVSHTAKSSAAASASSTSSAQMVAGKPVEVVHESVTTPSSNSNSLTRKKFAVTSVIQKTFEKQTLKKQNKTKQNDGKQQQQQHECKYSEEKAKQKFWGHNWT